MRKDPKKRIGLALSGGGMRAALFHMGVLKYIAEKGEFSQIANISTVSGASLVVALIFAQTGKWPSGEEFLATLPSIRQLILDNNIQAAALRLLPFSPRFWRNRVKLLAKVLEEKWNIHGSLQDLPTFPFWEINCTTFETGNNFRFRRDYMGDEKIGYVQKPMLPISHVIAASAAFPILIGPYILETGGMKFTKNKKGGQVTDVSRQYTLWDGGVYDNLGLDALYNPHSKRSSRHGLDNEIDFLIVSNASQELGRQERRGNISPANLRRLLDVSMNQVNLLREEQVISAIVRRRLGLYVKIGAEVPGISSHELSYVRRYPTTLNSPTAGDFDLLVRHGYDVARESEKALSKKNPL